MNLSHRDLLSLPSSFNLTNLLGSAGMRFKMLPWKNMLLYFIFMVEEPCGPLCMRFPRKSSVAFYNAIADKKAETGEQECLTLRLQ